MRSLRGGISRLNCFCRAFLPPLLACPTRLVILRNGMRDAHCPSPVCPNSQSGGVFPHVNFLSELTASGYGYSERIRPSRRGWPTELRASDHLVTLQ